MNRRFILASFMLLLAGLVACRKEWEEVFTGFRKPAHFPEPVYRITDNPVTREKFELGRKLFYDAALSANNTISCGSCHIPTSAFTHHGHSVSHGFNDQLGTRNSPPIMNLAWSTSFMWDGGIFDLDLQPVAPITNHVEMNETMDNVLNKLRNDPAYPGLFQKAYGSTEINSTRFLKALSQFMIMCISDQSKYDSVKRGQASFSQIEQAGYQVFQSKCGACHAEPLFTDNSFRSNGLAPSMINDLGRYPVTLNPADKYTFKVPSLRNLRFTAPYMHDGRLLTIESVLDHYASGIRNMENLDPLLNTGTSPGIVLSSTERQQLLAFLETLNDLTFVKNPLLAQQ